MDHTAGAQVLTSLFDVDPLALAASGFCLFTAFGLGTTIGLERQRRQRMAGLRTNALVGAGVIVKEGTQARGVNTAATR